MATFAIIVVALGCLWMKYTTQRQRDVMFGYLVLLIVVAYFGQLLTGQGLNLDF